MVEEGPHEKLMMAKGAYYKLVMKQVTKKDEDSDYDSLDPDNKLAEEMLENAAKADEENFDEVIDMKDEVDANKAEPEQASKFIRSFSLASDNIDDTIIDPDSKEKIKKISLLSIFRMNKPEWKIMLLGGFASAVMGATMPIYAWLFGEVLGILAEEPDIARAKSVDYAIAFLVVGVVAGIFMFLQALMFAISGEKLTTRIRKDTFSAMLSQEMAWFDEKANSTGALCARLSTDASKIQGATGSRVGTITQGIFTLGISLGISLYYSWKLGLVCSLFVPMLIIGMYFQMKIIMGHESVEKKAFESSAHLAIEAISNIRTVVGLQCETMFSERYEEELNGKSSLVEVVIANGFHSNNFAASTSKTSKQSHMRGFIFGFAQAIPQFAYGLTMWYGGYLVENDGLEFKDAFKYCHNLSVKC